MAAPCNHAFRVVKQTLWKSRLLSTCNSTASQNITTFFVSKKYQSTDSQARKETHFGFENVLEEEKEGKVYEVFENVAEKYDLMNDAMSGGIHRLWKDCFVRRLGPVPGSKLIDVAGGTGDIAFRCLDYSKSESESEQETSDELDFDIHIPREIQAKVYVDSAERLNSSDERADNTEDTPSWQSAKQGRHTHVTICDINQAMLEVGKKKAMERGFQEGRDVSWLRGNAECLPLEDNTFDGYTIAFGIRNVTHIDKVLDEAYRVLKPGGRFMCLEFSHVENPILRSLYDSYSFQVIPVMGQVIARDWNSYQYLVESIRKFPDQGTFASMIRQAGFSMVTFENLTFGVAAIHSGFKM
ncbi:ubiquinone/menaquinone biosynthesis C-methyltransferase UbiE-like [Liolophura sinensis]|uniref:ubiquinone/menaquinone biosynthesis C-methyltransferase UbiE-like n=1 Tax=Liolophura sinensis TaxID=3198878 RepID=UPI00315953FA